MKTLTEPDSLSPAVGGSADQARLLRELMERRETAAVPAASPRLQAARTIAVTSGKGGVGKSNVALNLALALAAQARVCLLDANVGLGNLDLLCAQNGYWNLAHVLSGARTLNEIMLTGPADVHLVPGVSGVAELFECPDGVQQGILQQLTHLEGTHDYLIVDTGGGVQRLVRQFAAAADQVLLVTTPEPTAIADAYATLKVLATDPGTQLQLLVNQVDSRDQAERVAGRLQQTARMFLHADLTAAGWIPRDPSVAAAVMKRVPFLIAAPQAPASKAVRTLAARIKILCGARPGRGAFFTRLCQRIEAETA